MSELLRRAVAIWDEAFAYAGPGGDAADVEHQAVLACVAVRGSYGLSVRGGPFFACAGVLLAPNVPHAYEASNAGILSVFLEPESPLGRRLLTRLGGADAVPLEAPWIAAVLGRTAPHAPLETRARALLAALAPDTLPTPLDARVARAMRHARAHLDRSLDLPELAAVVELSPERFRHLFRAQTGTPLKRWLRWARLRRAIEAVLAGASLTEAAHEAGFADGAHLSRTFRSMFGLSPLAARPDEAVAS